MVDLSKARAGDTVKFRCGGTAVIGSIEKHWYARNACHIVFSEHTDLAHEYHTNGESGFGVLTDIISVIPAPVAFDWKDARWGQAFKSKDDDNAIVFFVGHNPKLTPASYKTMVFTNHHGYLFTLNAEYDVKLTRAPEHDVEGV